MKDWKEIIKLPTDKEYKKFLKNINKPKKKNELLNKKRENNG